MDKSVDMRTIDLNDANYEEERENKPFLMLNNSIASQIEEKRKQIKLNSIKTHKDVLEEAYQRINQK
jgi:hypothetical protein